MKDTPSVTALIPAYNAASFIIPTLESVKAQTYKNFKAIISVDVSDDNTAELCREFCKDDARFQIFEQKENRLGYVGNCNFLLNSVRSDYVFFAFHDDLIEPLFSSKLSSKLFKNPDAVMAFCDVHYTSVDGVEEHWDYTFLEGIKNRVKRGLILLNRTGKWWVPNRGMFKLRRARRIMGLKRHGAGEFSPDWPWLFHMSLLGEFVRVPEILCHKIRKPDSLSRAWDFSNEQWYEALGSCCRELWISELTTDEKLALSIPIINTLNKFKSDLKVKKAQ